MQEANTSSTSSSSSSSSPVKFAVVQLTSQADKKSNAQIVESIISKAAESGAKMVFLPECAMFLGDSSAATIRAAEHGTQGKTVRKLTGLARTHKVWISVAGVQQVSGSTLN